MQTFIEKHGCAFSQIWPGTGGDEAIYRTGNVGIGMSSAPGSKLEVNGRIAFSTGDYGLGFNGNTNGVTTKPQIWNEGNNLLLNHYYTFQVRNNNATRLYLDESKVYFNSGNVGIGTTSPNGMLDVNIPSEGSNPVFIRRNNNGYTSIPSLSLTPYAGTNYAYRAMNFQIIKSDIHNTQHSIISNGYINWNNGALKITHSAYQTAGGLYWYGDGTTHIVSGTSPGQGNQGGTGGEFDIRYIASFLQNGNVSIGTTSPSEKLSVNGKVKTKEIIVTETGWSDYVFEDSYNLPSLEQVEGHIKTEKHLPGIPSAREVEANGVSLGEMQAKLLKKIEELTLYAIKQQKQIENLKLQMEEMKKGK